MRSRLGEVTGRRDRRCGRHSRCRGRRSRPDRGAGAGSDHRIQGAARAGREAESERHLAGDEHRVLGHRGASGGARSDRGSSARPTPCPAASASSKAARFPTSRRRWRRRRRTSRSGWSSIPEIKCYLPGVPRAMYMPYPFQIIQSQKHIMIDPRVRRRRADDLHGRSDRGAGRQLDGMVERQVGRRNAGRRHEGLQRHGVVRPRGQLPQRRAARRRALHARAAPRR